MKYSFNSEMLHEAKLRLEPSLTSHIEPPQANNHTGLMIVGLSLSVALALVLSSYNPIVGISSTAGMAEPIFEAITLFLPL